MKREGSLPHSQQPATCLGLEPVRACPVHFLTHFSTNPFYGYVFQVVSFIQVAPPKPCISPLLFPVRVKCTVHIILSYLIAWILFGEACKSQSSSLYSVLQFLVTSPNSGPNIFLGTLFANTLRLCSSPNVRDYLSYPYKTTGTIVVLRILKLIFLDTSWHTVYRAAYDSRHSLSWSCPQRDIIFLMCAIPVVCLNYMVK